MAPATSALRQLPAAVAAQFTGFARADGQLVWAESVTGRDGSPRTELWRVKVSGGSPRRITGDTGRVAFFGSEHDIVVASGRLYWTAEAPGREATEVRSVPITGGPMQVRTVPHDPHHPPARHRPPRLIGGGLRISNNASLTQPCRLRPDAPEG
jgi:hypothetical protein